MRRIMLTAVLSGTAMALAGCSDETEENTRAAIESAAADAEANAEAVAGDISEAVQNAGAEATDAKNTAEADLQDEAKSEAAVD
jgi:hypothetical protein